VEYVKSEFDYVVIYPKKESYFYSLVLTQIARKHFLELKVLEDLPSILFLLFFKTRDKMYKG
jgi:hypothetical protein